MKDLSEMIVADRCLEAVLLTSPHASAAIVRKASAVSVEQEGVVAVYFAEDLDGGNQASLLAGDKVEYPGQPVALLLGTSRSSCLAAVEKIEIKYHVSLGILDVEHAKAVRTLLDKQHSFECGNSEQALAASEILLEGSLSIAGQYAMGAGILAAVAQPLSEGRGITVSVPCESPSLVSAAVARVTGLAESQVRVEGQSMAGSAGARGEESIRIASLVAMAAMKAGAAVRLELDADQEFALTGKRHAVEAGFRVGFDQSGVISALQVDLVMDAGAENSHGITVLERAMLNADGVYGIKDFRVNGRLCRTNGITGTSIWAEGSAQGVFVIEEVIARVARRLGKTADTIRELNFYRSTKGSAVTAYGQKVDADLLSRMWITILSSSKLHQRRQAIEQWNQGSATSKRGIAAVPIKVGIGDPGALFNQATVWLQVCGDGSVKVAVSVVDLGEALLSRVSKQVGILFGIDGERVAVCSSMDGDRGPCLPAYGVDAVALIRAAVQDACDQINRRLEKYANAADDERQSFADKVTRACQQGENLAALGFSKQGALSWDAEIFKGVAFAGYFYGAAVIEVEVDAFTGDVKVLRADLFCKGDGAGEGGGAELDCEQIARVYMMGQAWVLNGDGADHCCIVPGLEEAPLDFRIELIELEGSSKGEQKPLGQEEGALVMAVAVREALKEAILAYAPGSPIDVDLPMPAGPAEVMRALREISQKVSEQKMEKKKSGGKA